ncbi:MAG TPA: ABC transporter substrate-binding protein [Candidatus Enterenecus stercoripullorum]|nr:ABC transporter substrate-binding protein [Candidatus Enterenecus stercoripullorum]
MKKKNFAALFLAGTMCFGLLAGCGGDAGSASDPADNSQAVSDAGSGESGSGTAGGTFQIGFIGPLTGNNASYGVSASQGAQIAVDEINALGGEIQFEISFQDDVSDAETAVNAYNTLMDDGMQMLIGPVTTGPAISVAAETYADRVFAVTPSASSLDVIDGKDNYFQICFTDPNQGISAATYLSENLPDATVAVIYNNGDSYSTGIYEAFAEEYASLGGEIVYTGTFTDDSQTDFSVQLTGAQNAGADLIFAPIYYTPASVILTQGDAMGYDFTLFGCDGMDGILGVEGFDTSLAEGMLLLTPFSADLEENATFVDAYEAAYGSTPTQFAADGYDCVYTLYTALQQAGCTSDMTAEDICEAVIPVMTQIQVDGMTGVLSWAATGEVTKDFDVYVVENGAYMVA